MDLNSVYQADAEYQETENRSHAVKGSNNKRSLYIFLSSLLVFGCVLGILLGLIPVYKSASQAKTAGANKSNQPLSKSLPLELVKFEQGSTNIMIELVHAGTFKARLGRKLIACENNTYNFERFKKQGESFLKSVVGFGQFISLITQSFDCRGTNRVAFSFKISLNSSSNSICEEAISNVINLFLQKAVGFGYPRGIKSLTINKVQRLKVNGNRALKNGTLVLYNNCKIKLGKRIPIDPNCSCIEIRPKYQLENAQEPQVITSDFVINQSTNEKPPVRDEALDIPKKIQNSKPSIVIPEQKDCGTINPDRLRVINGDDAQINEFPWTVSIRYKINGQNQDEHYCAGSIIYSEYVITAAHCVADVDVNNIEVVAGLNKLDEQLNEFNTFSVLNVYINPKYNPSSSFTNDIAILKLSKPVEFDYNVGSICLPLTNPSYAYNKEVVMVGWGSFKQGSSSMSNNLLQMKRKCVNDVDLCKSSGFNYDQETTYCAVVSGKEQDTCEGDSGGPMQIKINEKWFIYGVTSVGASDCVPTEPSFYAMVPIHLDWIVSIVDSN